MAAVTHHIDNTAKMLNELRKTLATESEGAPTPPLGRLKEVRDRVNQIDHVLLELGEAKTEAQAQDKALAEAQAQVKAQQAKSTA